MEYTCKIVLPDMTEQRVYVSAKDKQEAEVKIMKFIKRKMEDAEVRMEP